MKLLNEIQQKIKAPKTQKNSHGGYMYRSCSDILSAVKSLLGTATVHMTDELLEIGGRHYVKATVTIRHDGETEFATGYAREADQQKGMNAGQLSCSTSSYARKLALSGLFGIDDSHDAGNGKDEKPADLDALWKQAHFNYETENTAEIPEFFTCDFKKFKAAVQVEGRKQIPAGKQKTFAWSLESIKPFVLAIKLTDTLVDMTQ